MLDFNEIEFQFTWEDGRAAIVGAWHLVEQRDLTEQEIVWFEENFSTDIDYAAREQLL